MSLPNPGPDLTALRDHLRQTAAELHGPGPDGLRALALDTLNEVDPTILAESFELLAHRVGPDSRAELVRRVNETRDLSEEKKLRERLETEAEAYGYATALAVLWRMISEEPIPG